MNIEFVSHAGFIVEVNGVKIFTDPWLKGKAFNDSWALLVNNLKVNYEDIDYIFVTHEHPDHFNFPTLKSIKDEDKKRIKILYQEHASLRLKKAFERLGFSEVIELPIYQWTKIDGIGLYCGSAGSMDSFLAIKYNNQTILNLNDCVFKENQYRYIQRQVGRVDFLFTQFSFANWVGNTADESGSCEEKITDIFIQKEIFQPKYIIPFASFVYFCNQENSRMNAWINTPKAISELNIPEINFMYPGDKTECQLPSFNSNEAVAKYMANFQEIKVDLMPQSVKFEEVVQAIESNFKIFKQRIWYPVRQLVQPFGIYLHDLDKSILVDPKTGTWKETTKENTRFEMCSQVCWYTFKHEWGTGTLAVSGMYLDNDYPKPYSKYFFFQNMLSTGFLSTKSIPQTLRTIKFIWRKRWEIFYRFI